jgi:hypothetical protein
MMDALYNELDASTKQQFRQHLDSCEKCRKSYRKMKRTMAIMNQRVRVEPDQQFWDQYWPKLQQRIQQEKGVAVQRNLQLHRWIYRAAAVLFLIGIGVILGRLWLPTQTVVRTAPPADTPVLQAKLDQRTQAFLGRSEVLLLGLVNYDPETQASGSLNLSKQKAVSENLVQEAAYLKEELSNTDDRRLEKLVGDLELILMQIANLEEQEDRPEIDVVKSGVDRKGLLLKINLEQMRTARKNTQAMSKEPSGKKGI